MIPVVVPTTDVNSDTCIIVAWHAEDGDRVQRDQLIVEAETSKAVIEILAPEEGLLLREWPEGAEVALGAVVARLFGDPAALGAYREEKVRREREVERARPGGVNATRRAVELAQEHGLDLSEMGVKGLITAEDVERLVQARSMAGAGGLPEPIAAEPGKTRVLVVGGGLAATQVLDIYACRDDFQAVAVVDDDASKWSGDVAGVPIVGERLGWRSSSRSGRSMPPSSRSAHPSPFANGFESSAESWESRWRTRFIRPRVSPGT